MHGTGSGLCKMADFWWCWASGLFYRMLVRELIISWSGLSDFTEVIRRPEVAFCRWYLGTLSPRVQRPGREADHSPPSSSKIKKAWRYTSTLQEVLMAWCLVKHRDNFTLIRTYWSVWAMIRVLSGTEERYKFTEKQRWRSIAELFQ